MRPAEFQRQGVIVSRLDDLAEPGAAIKKESNKKRKKENGKCREWAPRIEGREAPPAIARRALVYTL